MTEPANVPPISGEALVGYVVRAEKVLFVEEKNGYSCTVIEYRAEDVDGCGQYLCRFDDGSEWWVAHENMRSI